MLNRKIVIIGILVFMMGIVTNTLARSNNTTSRQTFVTAQDMLPSPSVPPASITPPHRLSSALGLGPRSKIHINGFLSAGGSKVDTAAGYTIPGHGTIDSHFNFAANSLVGLQFTADLVKNLQVVTQFVADGDDTNGNIAYRVNAAWAYLRYIVSPSFQIHVGRFRLPTFLYSSTEQVGYSYPWVQLPTEVYRVVPFDNLSGVSVLYRYSVGKTGWTLQIQPYYGANTSTFAIINAFSTEGVVVNFDEKNLKGILVSVGNSSFTLRANYANLKLNAYVPILDATLFSSKTMDYYSVGFRWTPRKLFLAGEYGKRNTPSQIAALEAYYGSIGYRIGQFMPIATYARLKTTNASALAIVPESSEAVQDQESYTLGVDYIINSNVAVKASVTQITPLNGTFGLFNSNPGRRHIILYGVSIDAIF